MFEKRSMRIHGLTTAVVAGMLACVAVGAGCSEQSDGGESASTPPDVVIHVYPLRGEIVSLPDPADPASELKIRHEAIDDFKMGDGEAAPMKAMTMSFVAGPDESLEALAVGDAVEFVFEMQWEPAAEMRAVGFKQLPEGAELNFGETDAHDHEHAGH